MFITDLTRIKEFRGIERTRLTAVENELALPDLAGLDSETAQKVGRLLGAQVLYYGSYAVYVGQLFHLHGRLIRVETGEIIIAEDERGKYDPDKIFDVVAAASKKLEKAIKGVSDSLLADTYYSRGRTAEEDEDDIDKAITLYRKALGYDPRMSIAYRRFSAWRGRSNLKPNLIPNLGRRLPI